MRRGPGVRFPSPTRIARGLHNGAVVVAEDLGASPIADLYRYTVACPYEAMAERCMEVIATGHYVDLGLAALAKFRAETSMRDNMVAALNLPVFAELAGG